MLSSENSFQFEYNFCARFKNLVNIYSVWNFGACVCAWMCERELLSGVRAT